MGNYDSTLTIAESIGGMSYSLSQFPLLLSVFAVILLGSILVISLRLWKQHSDLSAGIRNISPLSPTREIPSFRRALPLMAKELARVRRYQRSLAIMVLQLENNHYELSTNSAKAVVNDDGSYQSKSNLFQTAQLGFLLMATMLQDSLRESDIISFDAAKDKFVILLPESDKAEALHAAERLNNRFFKETSIGLRVGAAEFPVDGWIVEDLVNNAWSACQSISLDKKAIKRTTQDKGYAAN